MDGFLRNTFAPSELGIVRFRVSSACVSLGRSSNAGFASTAASTSSSDANNRFTSSRRFA
eukprot:CAMPEP_0117624834 /NCGR_PEP_ID=MMETSP0802-20121206/586_1 /TAXON_ID=38833 /ORGANISM="Micromonas sp., Strain CCMP2099" /LENGTH=59 /DNA_ID=CAMNT_0005428889 /DNA_START=40 /DNA_END=219 /DNA_ORIENTATION=+